MVDLIIVWLSTDGTPDSLNPSRQLPTPCPWFATCIFCSPNICSFYFSQSLGKPHEVRYYNPHFMNKEREAQRGAWLAQGLAEGDKAWKPGLLAQFSVPLVQGPPPHLWDPMQTGLSCCFHRSVYPPPFCHQTHTAAPYSQKTILSSESAVTLERTWKFIYTKVPRADKHPSIRRYNL